MGLVYIPTFTYHKNQPNVGKYTSPMDGMGTNLGIPWGISMCFFHKIRPGDHLDIVCFGRQGRILRFEYK